MLAKYRVTLEVTHGTWPYNSDVAYPFGYLFGKLYLQVDKGMNCVITHGMYEP
jgi:hypothetical protein